MASLAWTRRRGRLDDAAEAAQCMRVPGYLPLLCRCCSDVRLLSVWMPTRRLLLPVVYHCRIHNYTLQYDFMHDFQRLATEMVSRWLARDSRRLAPTMYWNWGVAHSDSCCFDSAGQGHLDHGDSSSPMSGGPLRDSSIVCAKALATCAAQERAATLKYIATRSLASEVNFISFETLKRILCAL